jgi:hypothetical protein
VSPGRNRTTGAPDTWLEISAIDADSSSAALATDWTLALVSSALRDAVIAWRDVPSAALVSCSARLVSRSVEPESWVVNWLNDSSNWLASSSRRVR